MQHVMSQTVNLSFNFIIPNSLFTLTGLCFSPSDGKMTHGKHMVNK